MSPATALRDTPTGRLTRQGAYPTGTTGSDYFTDGLGSVIATVNNTGAAVTQTYAYDPWGTLTNPSASDTLTNPSASDTNPYRYAGEYQDQPTGTYAVGARTLNTTFAVWTQPDPSGQDANPYAYAGDDPINATDPTGLESIVQKIESAAFGTAVGFAIDAIPAVGPTVAAAGGACAAGALDSYFDGGSFGDDFISCLEDGAIAGLGSAAFFAVKNTVLYLFANRG